MFQIQKLRTVAVIAYAMFHSSVDTTRLQEVRSKEVRVHAMILTRTNDINGRQTFKYTDKNLNHGTYTYGASEQQRSEDFSRNWHLGAKMLYRCMNGQTCCGQVQIQGGGVPARIDIEHGCNHFQGQDQPKDAARRVQ
jgi:hypothetical protein